MSFKTSNGHVIKVYKAAIYYDDRKICTLGVNNDEVLYDSKANRLIEDHGSAILFVAVFDGPNSDKMEAFSVKPTKAKKLVQALDHLLSLNSLSLQDLLLCLQNGQLAKFNVS